MLVTFSGLDGAGKSTQIDRLVSWFEARDRCVVRLWARGGYTPGFEALKRVARRLLGRRLPAPGASAARETKIARPVVARLWLTLAIVDLMLYWGVYLRYQRWRGRVVICDRYLDDTRLDFRRNFPQVPVERGLLWRLLAWTTPAPDAAFLLWVPVEVSQQRSREKNEPFPDGPQVLAWRLDAYMSEALFPSRCYVKLDGRRSVGAVADEISDVASALCLSAKRTDAS